jgi:hypothetical protein
VDRGNAPYFDDMYKDGKYYIQTKVNAKWLIDNDEHINTLMEVVNITGQKITVGSALYVRR